MVSCKPLKDKISCNFTRFTKKNMQNYFFFLFISSKYSINLYSIHQLYLYNWMQTNATRKSIDDDGSWRSIKKKKPRKNSECSTTCWKVYSMTEPGKKSIISKAVKPLLTGSISLSNATLQSQASSTLKGVGW